MRELYSGDFEPVLLPKKTRSGLRLDQALPEKETAPKLLRRGKLQPVRHWSKSVVQVGHLTLVRWRPTDQMSTPFEARQEIAAALAQRNAAANSLPAPPPAVDPTSILPTSSSNVAS